MKTKDPKINVNSITSLAHNAALNTRLAALVTTFTGQLRSFKTYAFGRNTKSDPRAFLVYMLIRDVVKVINAVAKKDERILAIQLLALKRTVVEVSDIVKIPINLLDDDVVTEDGFNIDLDPEEVKDRKKMERYLEHLRNLKDTEGV